MEQIEMMTNNEIKERKKVILNEFENQKTIIAKAYAIMISLQEENANLDKILDKRGGE